MAIDAADIAGLYGNSRIDPAGAAHVDANAPGNSSCRAVFLDRMLFYAV
jgi:hypothetical protein